MQLSFVFSGIGYALGKYKVSNRDILNLINSSYLGGFDRLRIEKSEDYIKYCSEYGEIDPFFWLTEIKMGFKYRYHVVPFPPTLQQYKYAENSIDLCVRAVEQALSKSGIRGEEIDAWFIGTATPQQPAPAIAEFVKAYFTNFENKTPTYSLTSACVGFNLNLQSAIYYLKNNPQTKHVIVAHSEVMSKLLLKETDFVPHATFGDSASAAVISKVETEKKVGVTETENFEDMQMLDFLGANKKGNLYMDARRIKSRAVPNIEFCFNSLLLKNNWTKNDIKYFIPHQTGNAIVHGVAQKAELELSKVFQEVQMNFGNLSGSSVPASLAVLQEQNMIEPEDKLVTAVAGLGGEYGGFSYIVPELKMQQKTNKELKNKKVLITGATGALGHKIAELFAQRSADLILHYNSNHDKAQQIKNHITDKYNVKISLYKADFLNNNEVEKLCKDIKTEYSGIDYIINTQAITGNLGRASQISDEEMEQVSQVNYKATKYICEKLEPIINSCVLFVGSVGEDAQFPGSASYVASKRALRAFARNYAKEVYHRNIRCIYYIPGIIDGGMTGKLNPEQINASMMMAGQKELIPLNEIAERIVKSVYIPKVLKVRNSYEGVLLVRKDGYDHY